MQKFQDVVLDSQGRPVSGAVIAVLSYPGGSPATVYQTDAVGTAYEPTTDELGTFCFYAIDGRYSYTVTVAGVLRKTVTDIFLQDNSGGGGSTANVAVGPFALDGNTTGTENVAIGYYALAVNNGSYNIAIGSRAMQLATGCISAVAIGNYALASSTGNANTAVGQSTLAANTTGVNNTALGNSSLLANITGSAVTAVGSNALAASLGSNNTAIGYAAGGNITTGTNNTAIGYLALAAAEGTSNAITLGNSSIATLRCQVTSITALSDARDKTDVADLSFGLDFINRLRPVSFTWNMRDGGKVGIKSSGFIAQELQAAQDLSGVDAASTLNLVYAENPDKLEATYGNLIPVLVKAIQELRAEVLELRAKVGM